MSYFYVFHWPNRWLFGIFCLLLAGGLPTSQAAPTRSLKNQGWAKTQKPHTRLLGGVCVIALVAFLGWYVYWYRKRIYSPSPNKPEKKCKIVLNQIKPGRTDRQKATIVQLKTSYHTTAYLHQNTLYNYIDKSVSKGHQEKDRIYWVAGQSVSAETKSTDGYKGFDFNYKRSYCRSNQSIADFVEDRVWIEVKGGETIHLYFQIDNTIDSKTHTLSVYYKDNAPLTLSLKGDRKFLEAFKAHNKPTGYQELTDGNLFLYVVATPPNETLPNEPVRYPIRKPSDTYCWGKKPEAYRVAQLLIDSCQYGSEKQQFHITLTNKQLIYLHTCYVTPDDIIIETKQTTYNYAIIKKLFYNTNAIYLLKQETSVVVPRRDLFEGKISDRTVTYPSYTNLTEDTTLEEWLKGIGYQRALERVDRLIWYVDVPKKMVAKYKQAVKFEKTHPHPGIFTSDHW